MYLTTPDLATVSHTQKATTPFLSTSTTTYLTRPHYLPTLPGPPHRTYSLLLLSLPTPFSSRDLAFVLSFIAPYLHTYLPSKQLSHPATPSTCRIHIPPTPPHQHQCLADSCARRSIVSCLTTPPLSPPPGRVPARKQGGTELHPRASRRLPASRLAGELRDELMADLCCASALNRTRLRQAHPEGILLRQPSHQ